MTESLDQILALIKKTGDRCVVIDRATKNNYVVMSIKDYEHLVFANKPEPLPRAQGIRAGFLEVESAPPTNTLNSPSTPCQERGVLQATNKEKAGRDPVKVATVEDEVEQTTIPLDSLHTEGSIVPDWWSEKTEKSQPLDEKQADDQYYLEPVES